MIKFLLSKPSPILQKSVVKAGRIPIIQAEHSKSKWPAGNPTDIKHAHEEDNFEQARNESHYASKVYTILRSGTGP